MAKPPLLVASALSAEEQSQLLTAVDVWEKALKASGEAIANELTARLAIITQWAPNAPEGTNTITLPGGRKLKVEVRINRKVANEQYEAALAFAASTKNNALVTLLDTVFRSKPELVVGEWKDLDNADRNKLSDIVTETPGTPGLKLEAVK